MACVDLQPKNICHSDTEKHHILVIHQTIVEKKRNKLIFLTFFINFNDYF